MTKPNPFLNSFPHYKKYRIIFALIPLFYLPCYISNGLIRQLTAEDGLYENLGAVLFLTTSIVFFVMAFKPRLFLYNNDNGHKKKIYLLLLGLLFFFAFGEEISWGQRIFNFSTPDSMKELNRQNEFNLHNLGIFHGRTSDGEEKTGLLKFLTMHRLFYLTFLTYLFIIPLLYNLNTRLKSFIDSIRLPVPSIIFGLFFVFNWVYGNILRALFTEIDSHGIVEIKETIFAFILLMFSLSWLQIQNLRKTKG